MIRKIKIEIIKDKLNKLQIEKKKLSDLYTQYQEQIKELQKKIIFVSGAEKALQELLIEKDINEQKQESSS